MDWTLRPLDLRSRNVFRIARGARSTFGNFVVRVREGEEWGEGEGAPVQYLGLDRETSIRALEAAGRDWLESPESPNDVERNFDRACERLGGERPALAALDAALWDFLGRRVEEPVWRMVGADPSGSPRTSFTIGIDEPERMLQRVVEAFSFPILKVKVGFEGDVELVRRLREGTDRVLRVDANGGWTPEQAVERLPALAALGVELVEQPLPRDRTDEMGPLLDASPIPLIADESCLDASEVDRVRGLFHGVNVKLAKCGGITPALRMIRAAREAKLTVMLGCMLESSLGVTAAAHLAPLVDVADLDGHLLLAEDPYRGVTVREGALQLPTGPGLGVERA
jgi:L-alanine-DL-glutamate epimerase-like enolase superfamily enzyme